ncbi:MAG: hypothetical protein OD814_001191, partial [Candidatus Alkanophagales archaeon MCA70_species_1]|nr:hypothetical protein [Candidatus Alkanophaga volatiphilum]
AAENPAEHESKKSDQGGIERNLGRDGAYGVGDEEIRPRWD